MQPHPATQTADFGTGNIVLAAALMAIGIPLDPACPVELIQKEGQSFGRYHLLHHSIDGKLQTEDMMRAWSRQKELPAGHCFAWLMTFIRCRPDGVSTVDDWMGWATDHCRQLQIPMIGLPANVAFIPDFIKAQPESRASYIFAFVHCRDLAMQLFMEKKRVKILQVKGPKTGALIDVKLPLHQRNELLARLEDAKR